MGKPAPPTVVFVVGTRPNFMKMAPLLRLADAASCWRNVLVHTGQHYDSNMSDAFFTSLSMRRPDVMLGVGSGSNTEQTSRILLGIERTIRAESPRLVVVVGDVNSTMASAMAAVQCGVEVAHVEAGLRSRDRSMPEEINRLITDQLSDYCLTPSREAGENLIREGIPPSRITFVGNIMIDALLSRLEEARGLSLRRTLGLESSDGRYVFATLHRPSNVDNPAQLAEIVRALCLIAGERPVVFSVHPRTRQRLDDFGIDTKALTILPPVGYLECLHLQDGAALVMTDSGGIQEETTVLGIPCLTLRTTTERPITILEGTNTLVPDRTCGPIMDAYSVALSRPRKASRPEGWDGLAAPRILEVLRAATAC